MRRFLSALATTALVGSAVLVGAPAAHAHEKANNECGSQNSTQIDTGVDTPEAGIFRAGAPVANAVEDNQPAENKGRRTIAIPDPQNPDTTGTHGLAYLDDRDYIGMAAMIHNYVFDPVLFATEVVRDGGEYDLDNLTWWSGEGGHDHSAGFWVFQETNYRGNGPNTQGWGLQRGGQQKQFHMINDNDDVYNALNDAWHLIFVPESHPPTAGDDPCGNNPATFDGNNGKVGADAVIF